MMPLCIVSFFGEVKLSVEKNTTFQDCKKLLQSRLLPIKGIFGSKGIHG
jgi:hypothetical protein